jgi:L-arabinokinase
MRDADAKWFEPALERLRRLPNDSDRRLASLISGDRPVTIARAPGRLDVMGGIADYSGSLVLEMPLACATFVIAQQQDEPRLDIVSLRDDRPFWFDMRLDHLLGQSADTLASWLVDRLDDRWPAYVVGSVLACLTAARVTKPRCGLRLLIVSEVPEGKGVSSSAALEVATMTATAACYGISMDGVALATACQWAENRIAGAPCGIMDQMTSALGRRDTLLRLRCQPAIVEGHVDVPAGYRFSGVDSGIRHAVTGNDYGTVRTAAFMGYRIIAGLAGLPVLEDGGRVRVSDAVWNGYLANISPSELERRFIDHLPSSMRGDEFLAQYGGITDVVTRVDPSRRYPVRAATSHPIYENDRVTRFAELLSSGLDQPGVAEEMGALMYKSHASYSSCGLGSDGTDRLVDLVSQAGPARGLFGAKITGGGSGGTVAILATSDARGAVHHIAEHYASETGKRPFVFDGSGPGAGELGVLTLETPRLLSR